MHKKIKEQVSVISESFQSHRPRLRRVLIVALIFVALILAALGSAAVYAAKYRGKVYPGIYAGGYHLGGLTPGKAQADIENFNNRYATEGIALSVTDKSGKKQVIVFHPVTGEDATLEVVSLDSDLLAKRAYTIGRTGGWLLRLAQPVALYFKPVRLAVPVSSDDASFKSALESTLSAFEQAPQNVTVVVERGLPAQYAIIPEQAGWIVDYEEVAKRIKRQLGKLSFMPVAVELKHVAPTITQADAEQVVPALPKIFSFGPISLHYIDVQTERRSEWPITPVQYGQWLEIRTDTQGGFMFGLRPEAVIAYLEREVRVSVDRSAQEAKFKMEDGLVKEFQGSRNGLRLNAEKTLADLDAAFRERNYVPESPIKTVAVAVDIVEPAIKTADVNDLGITGIIGVGVSSYKGSPPNRTKNIRQATQKLNGVLIKPSEEFSTNKSAGPYTRENGYLPDLVIKGREIKLESGGGMCQISTTLFRMAMNSGMPITERRNHSLVVNYYFDPVNRNPGTDATVYDPLVDFKFLNDTGGYVLVQTEMDEKRKELVYTLWGQPDGRKGSYTHPVVSKWFAPGEPQEIEADTLKPGEKKCQPAYRGARASFTYTRITPQGEKIERVFESYYRPLPQICMVGKAESIEEVPADIAPADGATELSEPAI